MGNLEHKYKLTIDRLVLLIDEGEDIDILNSICESDNVEKKDWDDVIQIAVMKVYDKDE